MTCNRSIGKLGEEAARQYLEDIGYKIVEVNYRDKQGEADIIGFDGDILAFIEVKTRRSTRYGTPGEAVNTEKRYRLTRIAMSYMSRNRMFHKQGRFDVVEVVMHGNEVKQIRLIKDAFDAIR